MGPDQIAELVERYVVGDVPVPNDQIGHRSIPRRLRFKEPEAVARDIVLHPDVIAEKGADAGAVRPDP